jgi:thiamine transport system substrate-binding protein
MPLALRRLAVQSVALVSVGALALSGCSMTGKEKNPQGTGDTPAASDAPVEGSTVTLVTHDSFHLPAKLIAAFESDTGLQLEVETAGDALANKLVLTKDHPLGDVVFGIDNGSAAFALQEGVFADYQADLPEGASRYLLAGAEEGSRLTPVDHGAVCVNVDLTWFEEKKIDPPSTLEDLTLPKYRDLTVLPGATGSTPGLLFMLATMDAYDEEWTDYWARLVANGVDIAKDWDDAYRGGFTAGEGDRPIVVSYDTSPPFTLDEKTGESTTAALLDTCIQQIEYAGVLANAENPAGARALVDFLVSPEVQAAIPESMYMFPVATGTPLPDVWATHAHQPSRVYSFKADELAEHRQEWLTEWRDVTTR